MNSGVATIDVAGIAVTVTVAYEAFVIAYELQLLKSPVLHPAKLVVGMGVECDSNAKPLLLQLCIRTRCLIIQLQRMPFIFKDLKDFLADSKITFVVPNSRSAAAKLKEGHGLEIAHAVDLCTLPSEQNLWDTDLEQQARKVCGISFSKAPRLPCFYSHSSVLSNDEIRNAAIDAYAAYIIGAKLLKACECSPIIYWFGGGKHE